MLCLALPRSVAFAGRAAMSHGAGGRRAPCSLVGLPAGSCGRLPGARAAGSGGRPLQVSKFKLLDTNGNDYFMFVYAAYLDRTPAGDLPRPMGAEVRPITGGGPAAGACLPDQVCVEARAVWSLPICRAVLCLHAVVRPKFKYADADAPLRLSRRCGGPVSYARDDRCMDRQFIATRCGKGVKRCRHLCRASMGPSWLQAKVAGPSLTKMVR